MREDVNHRLKLHTPDRPLQLILLEPSDAWLLGRDPACEICIDHPSVSRRHARLSGPLDGRWQLEDLGSKNGTRLGGQNSAMHTVRAGDWFAVGDVYAVIESVESAHLRREAEQSQLRQHNSQLWMTRLSSLSGMAIGLAPQQRAERLIADLLRAVVEVAMADRGFLLLLDQQGQWRVNACHGVQPEQIQSVEFAGSRGALERALAQRQSVYLSESTDAAALAQRDSVIQGGIQALACLPLLDGSELLGAVYADTRETGRSFDALDAEMLEALVDQAGTVVAALALQERLAALGQCLVAEHKGRNAPAPTLQLAVPAGMAS